MAKKLIRIELIFPDKLIKAPVIYTIANKFNIIPNIFYAVVTETTGEIQLELKGKAADLKQGIRYFKKKGIEVKWKSKR